MDPEHPQGVQIGAHAMNTVRVPKRVTVQVKVAVDPEVWATTYGLPTESDAAKRALADDIVGHITNTVRAAATEALERIAAGAEVLV